MRFDILNRYKLFLFQIEGIKFFFGQNSDALWSKLMDRLDVIVGICDCKILETASIIDAEAEICSEPHETVRITENAIHLVVGQSVLDGQDTEVLVKKRVGL